MKFVYIFLVLVFCCVKVFPSGVDELHRNDSEIDNTLLENFVLYGIAYESLRSDLSSNVSASCKNDLKNILQSINRDELWALKVLDSSGTYRHSFVWGQNAWLGSKSECDFLNSPPKFTVSPDIPKSMVSNLITTTSEIELEFRMIFLKIKSPFKVDCPSHLVNAKILRLGLCLPFSCSDREIRAISQTFFDKKSMKFQKKYDVTLDVIQLRNMDVKNFYRRPEVSKIALTLVIIIASVVLCSTTYKFIEPTKMIELKRVFKCFSIYDNVASMFNTTSAPNAINSINGLRTCVCLWVILSHSVYFGMYAYDNFPIFISSLERIEIQPFLAIIFYMDAFFVFSGLLLTFNFLKDERTMNEIRTTNIFANLKLFFKKIIHRYIRLTPPLLFVTGISHILAIHMQESSSHYVDENYDAYCTTENFWRSVFYIQNFFPNNDQCIMWGWYLACDMQFYFITLVILFVYAKYPTLARSLFGILFISLTGFVIYSNDKINLLPRLDSLFYYHDEYYVEPWHRMHPYLAGITIGYVMFQLKDKTLPRHRYISVSFWIYATTTLVVTLFITYFKDISSLTFSLGLTVGRYFMGLYFGSIVSMCHFGYGGIVDKVLSSKFFVHLNKTTYMMYLIHPVWIIYLNSNQESSLHFDAPSVVAFCPSIMILSYISAIILSPIVEIPFQKLSDEYIMKKAKKSQPIV